MSINTMTRVFDQSQTEGSARVVMLALADRCDQDDVCWPSLADLAQRARLTTKRRVQQIIEEAEAIGEVWHKPGQGRGNTSLYIVCVGLDRASIFARLVKRFEIAPLEADGIASRIVANQRAERKEEAGFTFLEKVKSRAQKVKSRAQKVKSATLKGEAGFTRNHQEPSIEPSEESSGENTPPTRPAPYDETLDHPAVKVWREVMDNIPSAAQRQQIIAAIPPSDLEQWKVNLTFWRGQAWRVQSVSGQLDFHAKGGAAARAQRNGHAPTATRPSANPNVRIARNGVQVYTGE